MIPLATRAGQLAVVVLALVCGQVWAGELSAISAGSVSTATSATQAAKSEVRGWLEKAKAAEDEIEDAKIRKEKIDELAEYCFAYDQGDLGREVAVALPRQRRERITGIFPPSLLLEGGRPEAAMREAERLKNETAWWRLGFAFAEHGDVDKARECAARLKPYGYCSILCEVAVAQVEKADLAGAAATAAKIKGYEGMKEEEVEKFAALKKTADDWIEAGHFVFDPPGEQAAKFDPAGQEFKLSDIAAEQAKAGNLKPAERVLSVIKQPLLRSAVYRALADRHFELKQKKEFQESIEAAMKELSASTEFKEESGEIKTEAARFGAHEEVGALLGIVGRLARAGDMEAAVRTVGLVTADRLHYDWNIWQSLGQGDPEAVGYGGELGRVWVCLLAGQIDEAVKAATNKEGKLMPEAKPLLAEAYAAKGMKKELAALVKSAETPESEFEVCLAAARGAEKKAGVIPAEAGKK